VSILDTLTPEERQYRFRRICENAMRERREQGTAGIGTLAEKWQHIILKRYLSENTAEHEIPVEGTRFVSDVRIGNEVYEVQTGSFSPMKKKISHYLENTDLSVTVVHPIPKNRRVSWINPETLDISKPSLSPRHGRAEALLGELYPLIPYLQNPRLRFHILLIDAQDFKLLNPRSKNPKKGGGRFERIPINLIEERFFSSPDDYRSFLPEKLVGAFTVKEFSQATGIRGRDAYSAVRVLAALGLLRSAPPIGRSMAFERVD
jgi:hypothetical protein